MRRGQTIKTGAKRVLSLRQPRSLSAEPQCLDLFHGLMVP